MKVADHDIVDLADLVHDLCGIYLDDSKSYLMESRLEEVAQQAGCESFGKLVRMARNPANHNVRNDIVDAITTNETLFFRDTSPFEALRHKVLPDLIDRKGELGDDRRLRIWSAACSTGQEPYSLAMTVLETLPNAADWDITILGTDVSDRAIERASDGWYSELEVSRGLDPDRRSRFFGAVKGGWRVCDELRYLVAFEKRNLLDPFAERACFDIVFCRNVAIYFTPERRDELFQRIAATLVDDGCLFVGSSESAVGLGQPWFRQENHCRCCVYRRQGPADNG